MAVSLSANILSRYERFSLYNSPYVAHDRGCAIDLYPEAGPDRATSAPSPVAGEVLDTRTVRAPPQEYAVPDDHLIVIAVDPEASGLDASGAERERRVTLAELTAVSGEIGRAHV